MEDHIRGLTFIEMAVAVIIIGVLTLLVLISFSRISTQRVDAEARKIISDLREARTMANCQHQNYCIRFDFDSSNRRYFYEVYENSCSGNFVKRRDLEVDIVRFTVNGFPLSLPVSLPFDLIFYRFNNFPWRLGGQASHSLYIRISEGSVSEDIYIFRSTGYIKGGD